MITVIADACRAALLRISSDAMALNTNARCSGESGISVWPGCSRPWNVQQREQKPYPGQKKGCYQGSIKCGQIIGAKRTSTWLTRDSWVQRTPRRSTRVAAALSGSALSPCRHSGGAPCICSHFRQGQAVMQVLRNHSQPVSLVKRAVACVRMWREVSVER